MLNHQDTKAQSFTKKNHEVYLFFLVLLGVLVSPKRTSFGASWWFAFFTPFQSHAHP